MLDFDGVLGRMALGVYGKAIFSLKIKLKSTMMLV
jgi:hypothetical protein